MLFSEINWPVLFAVSVGSFLFGWLWYSPILFVKPWMAELKISSDKLKKMQKNGKVLMPIAFLGTLLMNFTMDLTVKVFRPSGFKDGLLLGIFFWLGFYVTSQVGYLFEGKSKKLILLSSVQNFFVYGISCGIFAIWN